MHRKLVIVALLAITTTIGAKAEILDTASMTTSYPMDGIEPHDGNVFLAMWVSIDIGHISDVYLFSDAGLDSSAVGTTVTATEITDGEDFEEAVWHLSYALYAGTPYIGIGYRSNYSGSTTYAKTINELFERNLGFIGYEIESISLRLDELSFDDTFVWRCRIASGVVIPCEVTGVTVTGTIIIEGTPELNPVESTTWGQVKALFVDR